MSANWGNLENIYSLGVLPPVTHRRHPPARNPAARRASHCAIVRCHECVLSEAADAVPVCPLCFFGDTLTEQQRLDIQAEGLEALRHVFHQNDGEKIHRRGKNENAKEWSKEPRARAPVCNRSN